MLVVLGQDDDLKAGRAKERREGTEEKNARGRMCWKMKRSGGVSLARAATSIIFVATKVLLRQNYVCRDKHNKIVCRDKNLSRQTRQNYVCRDNYLSRQKYVCRDKQSFVATKDVFCVCRNNKKIVARKTILVAAPASDSGMLGKNGNRRGEGNAW